MSLYPLILQTVASLTGIATTTGLFIAYRQFRLATRQAQSTFEDALAREYRQVAHRIPVRALLGDDLPESQSGFTLDEFYWYFDLTNEQIFLRRNGRVSDAAWANWREGIRANLRKPAFAKAWDEIARRAPGSFNDLRRLEAGRFREDPREWRDRAPAGDDGPRRERNRAPVQAPGSKHHPVEHAGQDAA